MSNLAGWTAAVREPLSILLILLGASLLLLATVGVVRMPDLFTRMQTASKASTLGVACMLLAAAVHFSNVSVTSRALAAVAFFFLTAPVTAHLIARAAYSVGTPLWEDTVIDELRGHYDVTAPGRAGGAEREDRDDVARDGAG
jgi:multicomponent Na+:H+ antiporter subunit G